MDMRTHIEDYALLGDCETAALVSRQGSIDWLCWPNFASPACFAALLGTEDNGHWSIAPAANARSTRCYRQGTLVLETTFENDEGAVCLIDLMPIRDKFSHVVRIVRGIRGRLPMCMQLVLRFDYGRSVPWVTRTEEGAFRAIAGPDMVIMRTNARFRGQDLKTLSDFTVEREQSVWFTMTYSPSYEDAPAPIDAEEELRQTTQLWQQWTGRATYEGEYKDAVERSLLTLKALTYRPTGGIIAAPTTSLPECLGGQCNWDYRYCWLRDATFSLLTLMNAGYYDEAKAWRDWLLRAAAGSPDQLQIMYGIRGERHLLEWPAEWLPGYADSKPVRVGNSASEQLQLDVYGEVADALLHAHLGGIPWSRTDLDLQCSLTAHLAQIWQQPDHGIWEVRSLPQHFTHSKIMVWVALDRAVQSVEKSGMAAGKADVQHWRALRDKVHRDVCRHGFNQQINSFTQAYGSKVLDAALLLVPLLGFLPATDPRVRGTVEAVEKQLMRDGFVLRYNTEETVDGLPPGEGIFVACSLWMVCALSRLGRHDDARRFVRAGTGAAQ